MVKKTKDVEDKGIETVVVEEKKDVEDEIPLMDTDDNDFLKKYATFINSRKKNIDHSNKIDNLLDYIQFNLNNLSDRVRIVRLKYTRYKKLYDSLNICIIVISAFLTLFSAITSQLQTEIDESIVVQHIIGIITIIL